MIDFFSQCMAEVRAECWLVKELPYKRRNDSHRIANFSQAGPCRLYNVDHDVVSTLMWRCINVMCLLVCV